MNWGQSYSASWRVFRVNRDTWADGEQITNVDSVSITRTADGSLLESGGFQVTGDFQPDYYRIVMTAIQGGDVERVDVATMLFDTSKGEYDFGVQTQDLEGYSVLYPASKSTVIMGEYAPAGIDGAQYVGDLLADAINAPVMVEGSFTLNDHIVHEIGSTVLKAAWEVLDAGNFVIQIDGRGVVHILPRPTDPALVIDNSNTRILSNGISYSTDISAVPNRYIVINGQNMTIATNADPDSVVSSYSRGYFVDEVDDSPTPIDGETISAYANRRLHELSYMKETCEYTREYAPNVFLYSIVKSSIDGMDGNLRVNGQTVSCDKGITISEKSVKEVNLWV